MKKLKFTEEQIAFTIKQAETGPRVEEVCRKMGISEETFYNWKKKSDILRLLHIKFNGDHHNGIWFGIRKAATLMIFFVY